MLHVQVNPVFLEVAILQVFILLLIGTVFVLSFSLPTVESVACAPVQTSEGPDARPWFCDFFESTC